MNLTLPEGHSKPLSFNYIKPYMVYFQKIQKILRKNLRFTRNSESKREFFTKHTQVNIIWLGPFLALIFEFWSLLITFYWLWIDLTKGNGQNQAFKASCLRYWVLNFLFISALVFNVLILFILYNVWLE